MLLARYARRAAINEIKDQVTLSKGAETSHDYITQHALTKNKFFANNPITNE